MLLKDKYCPKKLSDYQVHQPIISNLVNYLKYSDISNIIISGPPGSGKYTLAQCILAEFYGLEIYNKESKEINVKVSNNNIKTINVVKSKYHFELFVNKYVFNDKLSLINYISELTNTKSINNNSYKIILIKNCDLLSKEVITYIKRILETSVETCRIIMTGTNSSKLHNIVNCCFNIRLPSPPILELTQMINTIKKKENLHLTSNNITEIISDSDRNIGRVLIILEHTLLDGKYTKFNNPINKQLKNFVSLISQRKASSIPKIREELYILACNNIEFNKIIKYMVNYFIKSELSNNIKKKIIELAAYYDYKLSVCYKELIHLEALVINIIDVLIQDL